MIQLAPQRLSEKFRGLTLPGPPKLWGFVDEELGFLWGGAELAPAPYWGNFFINTRE